MTSVLRTKYRKVGFLPIGALVWNSSEFQTKGRTKTRILSVQALYCNTAVILGAAPSCCGVSEVFLDPLSVIADHKHRANWFGLRFCFMRALSLLNRKAEQTLHSTRKLFYDTILYSSIAPALVVVTFLVSDRDRQSWHLNSLNYFYSLRYSIRSVMSADNDGEHHCCRSCERWN